MKLGLALGGGGARGAAHLGVLMELERLGIRPDLITGTSIGGMVGALAAAGLDLTDIVAFFQKLDLGQIYTWPGRSVPAVTNTSKIERLLVNTLGRLTFADLQIPLAVVTTDLVSRKQVILDEGDLIAAVLATIAMPVFLPPVEWDSHILIDGGLLNNTPFDISRARGASYVIAVDLTNTTSYGQQTELPPPPPGVVARALALTQRQPTWQILSAVIDIITTNTLHAHLAVSQPDILLQPELGSIGLFDFHRWEEAIAVGRAAVQAVEEELRLVSSKQ